MAKADSKPNGFSIFNRPWVIAGIVAAIVILVIVGGIISTYNGLVSRDVAVDTAWSQVETSYQRRADLIPNLVATVQGAADFETSTQTQIAQLRTQALAIKSEMQSANTPAELEAADEKLQAVMSTYRGLNINVENYPQLRASENFLALQDELANTENKVAVERGRYNEAVQSYNTKIRTFPSNLVAGMFGFEKREFFEAKEEAENAPVVEFN